MSPILDLDLSPLDAATDSAERSRDLGQVTEALSAIEAVEARLHACRARLVGVLGGSSSATSEDRLVTAKEAASRIGMSIHWVRRAENGKQLGAVLIGGSRRYSSNAIDSFIARLRRRFA